MFDSLGNRLDGIFKRLRARGKLTEGDVEEALREIRLALLEADVALSVVRRFAAFVKQRAVGEEVARSVTPGQQVVKIVHEALIDVLGSNPSPLAKAPSPPTVILLAGLQGSGKTTGCAKVAKYLKGQGHSVVLAACDLQRPAAVKQLQVLADQVGVPMIGPLEGERDPVAVAERALDWVRGRGDVLIVDTAGRLHVDEELMQQAALISRVLAPHELLYVLDAQAGQDAVVAARAFVQSVSVTGIILTKLDGDARGGAALSAVSEMGVPIKFASIGEKLGDLELFHPDRMASRILGMGDVLTLVERAEAVISKEDARKAEEALRKGEFSFEDFLDQMQQIRKMGSMSEILSMLPAIPGIGRLPDSAVDDGQLRRVEAVIRSMTPGERRKPDTIDGSRRRRIALGSAVQVREVNAILRQFDEARRLMKRFGKMKLGRGKSIL